MPTCWVLSLNDSTVASRPQPLMVMASVLASCSVVVRLKKPQPNSMVSPGTTATMAAIMSAVASAPGSIT